MAFDITAQQSRGFYARLVNVGPGLDGSAFSRHGVYAGDKVGFRKLDGLRSLQRCADCKHSDLALVGLQVGDECAEIGFDHLKLRPELFCQLL